MSRPVDDIERLALEALAAEDATVGSIMVGVARLGALGVIDGDENRAKAASEVLRAGARMAEATDGGDSGPSEKLRKLVDGVTKRREEREARKREEG